MEASQTAFEDVYSQAPGHSGDEPVVVRVELNVLLESCPGALARLFSLLCLFGLVPAWARSVNRPDGVIRQTFCFTDIPEKRISLLVGKVSQLTECLEVEIGQALG